MNNETKTPLEQEQEQDELEQEQEQDEKVIKAPRKALKKVIACNQMLVDLLIKAAAIMKAITMLADLLNMNGPELDNLDIANNGELLPDEAVFNKAQDGIISTCDVLYQSINKMLEQLNKHYINKNEVQNEEQDNLK